MALKMALGTVVHMPDNDGQRNRITIQGTLVFPFVWSAMRLIYPRSGSVVQEPPWPGSCSFWYSQSRELGRIPAPLLSWKMVASVSHYLLWCSNSPQIWPVGRPSDALCPLMSSHSSSLAPSRSLSRLICSFPALTHMQFLKTSCAWNRVPRAGDGAQKGALPIHNFSLSQQTKQKKSIYLSSVNLSSICLSSFKLSPIHRLPI